MHVAVISDIHDHIDNLRRVLGDASEAELLICCGDLCSPFMVDELAGGFAGPTHVVFGNNDGDPFRITRAAREHDHFHLAGEFVEIPPDEADGRRIAAHHFPEVGRALADSGRYDLVCFGHSHEYEEGRAGEARYVNPGEVMGRLGSVTYALYDTGSGEILRREP